MDIDGLADGPVVLGRLIGGPDGAGNDTVPTVLPLQMQQRVKPHPRLGRRGMMQGTAQLRRALLAQNLH